VTFIISVITAAATALTYRSGFVFAALVSIALALLARVFVMSHGSFILRGLDLQTATYPVAKLLNGPYILTAEATLTMKLSRRFSSSMQTAAASKHHWN